MTGLGGAHHQVMQCAQLVLAVSVLERQVHQEDADVVQLEFDDQTLDAGVEVMEALARHTRRGQQRVRLFAHDRQQLVDGGRAVLALMGGIVADRVGDVGGLVEHAGAHRAGVDFHQTHDVRVLGADEGRDLLEHPSAAAQVAGARHRQMERRAGTGRVADVIDDQSHAPARPHYPRLRCPQYTAGMHQRDPIRVFVTHCFEESDDYVRVFEYLESARNFYYRNCSAPDFRPGLPSPEALREELRREITTAEVVVALTSLAPRQQDLLDPAQLRQSQRQAGAAAAAVRTRSTATQDPGWTD